MVQTGMGLDMYLCKYPKVYKDGQRVDLVNNDPEELKESNPELYRFLKPYLKTEGSGSFQWESFSKTVGYWRKANQIHNWFVTNVKDGIDECRPSLATKEQLEQLKSLCEHVKEHCHLTPGAVTNGYARSSNGDMQAIIEDGAVIQDSTIAEECLPTMSGFFFGSTNYDEHYVIDITDSIDILTTVLAETDFENEEIYYLPSW